MNLDPDSHDNVDWQSQREATNRFWLTALLVVLRVFGRTAARWVLLPVVAAFSFVFNGPARRASRRYLRRVDGCSGSLGEVFRHMHTFATVSADRLVLMDQGSENFSIELVNTECFADLTAGAILVTSHFGSFDVMRVEADTLQPIPIHIMLDVAHNQKTLALINRLNPVMASRIVDAGVGGPKLILKLKNLLESNRLVGVMADRVVGGQRTQQVDFLGGRAKFPLGPWLMAAILEKPVILCFGVFLGGNRYRVTCERLMLDPSGRTKEKAEKALLQYVQRLEHYVDQAPFNWFNFYDFWENENSNERPQS
jgi:predicted LPLAT superfamily acyltransferase